MMLTSGGAIMRLPFQESVDSLKTGNYSAHRQPVMENDNEYQVTWVGIDGSYNEDEFSCLDDAKRDALSISEHGGHCITISLMMRVMITVSNGKATFRRLFFFSTLRQRIKAHRRTSVFFRVVG